MPDAKRIKWVDLAKGFAILLVIAGHTIGYPKDPTNQKIIRGLIYSFHMPLFFLLSGYTYRSSSSKEQLISGLKRSAKRLLLPAYILWLALTLFEWLSGKAAYPYSLFQLGLSALFACAIPLQINDIVIPLFGFMWFSAALFVLKNLYDFLNYILKGRFMTLASILISVAGALIGKTFFLPFGIDIAMASMIFYHIGRLLKEKDVRLSAPKFAVMFFIWTGAFYRIFCI